MIYETPKMKLVKSTERYIKKHFQLDPLFKQEDIIQMMNSYNEAYMKLAHNISEEMNISIESAIYYIKKYLDIDIIVENDKAYLKSSFKPVGELLDYEPISEYDLRMEEQLEKEILGIDEISYKAWSGKL